MHSSKKTVSKGQNCIEKSTLINLSQNIMEKTNCNKNYSPLFAFVLSQRTIEPQSQGPKARIITTGSQNGNKDQHHQHKSRDFWLTIAESNGCRRPAALAAVFSRFSSAQKQMLSIHHLPLCGCHKFIHLFSGHDFIIRSRSSRASRQLYCVDLQLGCRNSIYTANGRPIKHQDWVFHIRVCVWMCVLRGGNVRA